MTEDTDKLDPALLRVIRALARADAVHDLDAIRRDQDCEIPLRRPASFTQADVRRAVAAVEASGKSVGAIDFPPSGGFRIIIGEAAPVTEPNEWDDVLAPHFGQAAKAPVTVKERAAKAVARRQNRPR